MMDPKVIDNFLPKVEHERVVFLLQNVIPWFYNDHVVNPEDRLDPIKYQMVSPIWAWGKFHNEVCLTPELASYFERALDIRTWVRIKANLSIKNTKIIEQDLHIDGNFGDYTAVYYINTCNGYTYFKNGKKVESVANRMVIFPRDTMHSGTTSTDSYRQVINFNYYGHD